MQEGEEEPDGPPLHFEVINAKYTQGTGVVCHIAATFEDAEILSNPQEIRNNLEHIEIFHCKGVKIDENGDQKLLDPIQLSDEEKEQFLSGGSQQEEGEEEEEEEEERGDGLRLGGGSKQSPKLITTSSLAKLLSKTAKQ